MNFDEFWTKLCSELKQEKEFETLTQHKKFKASLEQNKEGELSILIVPESRLERRIPRNEVEGVWNNAIGLPYKIRLKNIKQLETYTTKRGKIGKSMQLSYITKLIDHIVKEQSIEPIFPDFGLENLEKLHEDIEKQMLLFDEIVPFERQETAKIFSPRLLNLMLACCPQIEAVTKWISNKYGMKGNGIPQLIREINQGLVLSSFRIISTHHKLQFTPFTQDLSWWHAYNELKHDLNGKQFKLSYQTVMDAFAALAGLHCLAKHANSDNMEYLDMILDSKHWTSDRGTIAYYKSRSVETKIVINPTYKSLMFEIETIFLT